MTASPSLAIDAATYIGTVAIISAEEVLAEAEIAMRGKSEERLMPAVAQALRQAGISVTELGAVICGAGPGSFTSLRIAASIAKGVASGGGIPLFSVPSLLLMLAGSSRSSVPGRYLTVLNAMRSEVFAACYEVVEYGTIEEISPVALIGADSLAAYAQGLGATIMGHGQSLDAYPRAQGAALLGRSRSMREVDVGAWEPEYGRLAEAQVKWESVRGPRQQGP